MNPPDPTPEDIVEETRRLLGKARLDLSDGDAVKLLRKNAFDYGRMIGARGDLEIEAPRLLSALVAEVERLRNSYQMMLEVHRHCAQLREERDRLRGALQAGWTLGQYEWAQKHSDELRQEGET
jgi:hypothetical protein